MTAHWSRDYVGIPYLRAGRSMAGTDCYGLLWLVYRDILGIALASYAAETVDAAEREQIADLVADRSKSPWLTIESAAAREFDVVVFKRARLESHVGIVVEPGRMLHIVKTDTESYVDSFVTGRWKTKFVACHRHESRA